MITNFTELEVANGTKEAPFTPYKAAGIVNKVLEAEGIDTHVPPQMMYNYTKQRVAKGKAPLIKYDDVKGIDAKDFVRWLEAYVTKKLTPKTVEETVEA